MIYETIVTKMMISVVFRIRKPENNKYLESFYKGFCFEFRVNFALRWLQVTMYKIFIVF